MAAWLRIGETAAQRTTEINNKASELLCIPSLTGINVHERLWLCWQMDVQKDQTGSHLVSLATRFPRETPPALP